MTWVNFKELREKLDFRTVLEHYGVTINAKNHVQHHSKCPLPTHATPNRSSAFSANLEKGIWRCFGCGAQGNILDFAARMEKLDPGKADDIRRTALLLADRYQIASQKPTARTAKPKPSTTPVQGPTLMNAPLDFTLKGLETDHPYLLDRGFTPETIKHFELGYCSRGLMQGRIAIPLRNAEGKLIGYAGRIVDESVFTEENPKYRFPATRVHDGRTYKFAKSLFLYNSHSIPEQAEDLVIVEGFASVWWLVQNGFPNTVALMGSTVSSEQMALIVGTVPRSGRLWIMTAGDQAGNFCAESLFKELAPYRFVRWAQLRNGRKPTDCSVEELRTLIG